MGYLPTLASKDRLPRSGKWSQKPKTPAGGQGRDPPGQGEKSSASSTPQKGGGRPLRRRRDRRRYRIINSDVARANHNDLVTSNCDAGGMSPTATNHIIMRRPASSPMLHLIQLQRLTCEMVRQLQRRKYPSLGTTLRQSHRSYLGPIVIERPTTHATSDQFITTVSTLHHQRTQ